MITRISIFSLFFNFLLILPAYSQVQVAEIPPDLEKILDPSKPWGLNLDLVDQRQRMMRKKGIADDYSTKIVLYRGNKAIMGKKVEEKVMLTKKAQDIEAKTQASIKALNPLNLPGRSALKKKRDQDIAALQKQIDDIDKSLFLYKDATSKLVISIMQETGLPPEQVARIPAAGK